MFKNILALIGLVTAVNYGVKGYNKYLKQPLESKLTEVFDDESKASATWINEQREKWDAKIREGAKAVGEAARIKHRTSGGGSQTEDAVAETAEAAFIASFIPA